MMKLKVLVIGIIGISALISCKKKGCTDETAINYSEKAKKDDGSCYYTELVVPTTYTFKDANNNNTVSYTGQTERLDQLQEMLTYIKSGTSGTLDLATITAMFENTNGDGDGHFSFTSTKQLKDKCFASDVPLFEGYFNSVVIASANFASTASSGNAGVLTSGTSSYLVADNGMEYAQIIEKGLMSAIFMNQATAVYFSADKMDVDNTTAVDAGAGQYYTAMEHHWDEAFGYFGAPIDFPTNLTGIRFWSKYSNSQNGNLNCNATLMNAFLKGRAAISQQIESVRDEQISIIRKTWERVAASQALTYLKEAKGHFGGDNAKFMHGLSEAYGFILGLKYLPLETREITYPEINTLLETTIGSNFWAITVSDLNQAISDLSTIYGF